MFQGGGSKVDLIIAYMPEGLPVPNVSTPPYVIHPLNNHKHDNVEALFELSNAYLNNGDCMLLFLPEIKNV